MLAPTLVFVDADNTLWDTDKVYADAQLALLGRIEKALDRTDNLGDRLAFVRELDQLIAERHHAGLRYPPRLLAKAIALAFSGLSARKAVRIAWAESGDTGISPDLDVENEQALFFRDLRKRPKLRPGVEEGLRELKKSDCFVFVISEGSREKNNRLLEHFGLRDYVDRIIEAPKTAQLYKRVMALVPEVDTAIMVGDQLDRDIIPAKQAGLTTVYFPGKFIPKWAPSENATNPHFRISRFNELVDIVREQRYRAA